MMILPLLRPVPGGQDTVSIDPEMVLAISPLGLRACTVRHYTADPVVMESSDVRASVREVRQAVEAKR